MAEKESVRRSYDALAETYAAQRSGDGPGMDVLEAFLESLDDAASVLDAGCGQGTPVLARLGAEATAVGVDFSREQLRLAARNAPGAAVCQGDVTDLPFGDDVFDGVVAYWSLIHVPLGEHRAVLDEFARVLRPGGRALVCEGTNEWVGENPDWLDSGVEMQWEIAGAAATQRQLRAAGFRIDRTWGVPEPLAEDADADGTADEADDGKESDDGEESDGGEETGDGEAADDDPWTFFDARLEPA